MIMKPESKTPAKAVSSTTPEERRTLIAQSAYLLAERRGFQSSPERNWLDAEVDFDKFTVGSGSSDERAQPLVR